MNFTLTDCSAMRLLDEVAPLRSWIVDPLSAAVHVLPAGAETVNGGVVDTVKPDGTEILAEPSDWLLVGAFSIVNV